MFTEKTQAIIDLAKDHAYSSHRSELGLSSLLVAFGAQTEPAVLLAECLGLSTDKLQAYAGERPITDHCPAKLPLAEATRAALECATEYAQEVPDRSHPGLVDVRHLACALAGSREVCAALQATPLSREDSIALLTAWYDKAIQAPRLAELTERLRAMQAELLQKVFGQDHAIHAFVEGLFSAEVVAAADAQRRSPRALFVFAGPPGVGKTFLAELGASILKRPFRRFDMSAYSGHQQNEALVGMARSFHGAHPGTLTEFVEKNPDAVLLFDEIEKAHTKTIHLFLQVLDAGVLEDKYHERNVNFRDTTIILTTNAGKKLYDRPNESGVMAANAAFHRKTILDALETEKDPHTGEPFFPAAICSRMSTGYPVLFNRLRVNELERVVCAELSRVATLMERQYYMRVSVDDLLPMSLVLREGARADARTLRSQAEAFVKGELFKFCQLFKPDRLEEVLDATESITFTFDENPSELHPEIQQLFELNEKPRVLLVAAADLAALYHQHICEVDWLTATTAEEALEHLAQREVDMVLLDLWMGQSPHGSSATIQQFDHVPAAARGLDRGQELLHKVRERLPGMPVFLLSLAEAKKRQGAYGSIDEELFLACVRGGGARGMIVSQFIDEFLPNWEQQRDRFARELVYICRRLHRERMADRMGQERKVLTFDTVPHLDEDAAAVTIRLRNFRLTRAIAAADAGEILEEVERPCTRFEEVIGADGAKEELKFFIDYLKNPRRFAALGLKPPKGVLLHGPPGTGKTMLARAMAGESNVAFLPVSATNFVTIWQGSGPQNVRELFARARRYAPAIVFIDEIDAIGKPRAGRAGGGQAEENTLNALLTEMDGFTSPSPDRPVFVLAATNFNVNDREESPRESRRKLDPALVRRFSRTILVDLPERAARQQYLSKQLRERASCRASDEIISLLAERSSGMSIANLESVIETAARNAAQQGTELTDELLEEALETVRYGEARVRDAQQVRRTACHEAGHTLLYWLSGYWPAYVTVVSRGSHGGYMAPCSEEAEKGDFTRSELLWKIRGMLGGRAAEQMVYGDVDGPTTGASNDLERATDLARKMVCRYGMDEDFGLLATPELMKYEGALSSPVFIKLNDAAGRILREQMTETLRLLKENREHLDKVVESLTKRERLTMEDLKGMLPSKAQIGKRG